MGKKRKEKKAFPIVVAVPCIYINATLISGTVEETP